MFWTSCIVGPNDITIIWIDFFTRQMIDSFYNNEEWRNNNNRRRNNIKRYINYNNKFKLGNKYNFDLNFNELRTIIEDNPYTKNNQHSNNNGKKFALFINRYDKNFAIDKYLNVNKIEKEYNKEYSKEFNTNLINNEKIYMIIWFRSLRTY